MLNSVVWVQRHPFPVTRQAVCSAEIKAGMALDISNNGTVGPAGVPADGGRVLARFADMNTSTGGTIDTPWPTGSTVSFGVAMTGDRVWALLAAGQNVAIGAKMCNGAAGTVVAVAGLKQARYEAVEAVDNSGGANPVRVLVEVM